MEDSELQLKIVEGGKGEDEQQQSVEEQKKSAEKLLKAMRISPESDIYKSVRQELIDILSQDFIVLEDPIDIRIQFPLLKEGEKIYGENGWETVSSNLNNVISTDKNEAGTDYSSDEKLNQVLASTKALAIFKRREPNAQVNELPPAMAA